MRHSQERAFITNSSFVSHELVIHSSLLRSSFEELCILVSSFVIRHSDFVIRPHLPARPRATSFMSGRGRICSHQVPVSSSPGMKSPADLPATATSGPPPPRAPADGCGDPLPRRHDLLGWPGNRLFQLEVAGREGRLELMGLRIAGRVVTDVVKDEIWEDAEECVRQMNEGAKAES